MRDRLSARRVLLACAVGLVVGIGAFVLTSGGLGGRVLGLCHPATQAGFNPWTGIPYGATWSGEQIPLGNCGPARQDPPPPDIATRWAIPVPLGFAVGVGIVLLVLPRRNAGRGHPPATNSST